MSNLPNLASAELKNLKAVLMDFDNTFYAYDPCHTYAFNQTYRRIKILTDWSKETYKEKYQEAQKIVKASAGVSAASHSRLLYFQILLEQALGKSLISEALTLEKTYWDSFLSKMVIRKNILAFVADCRKRGLPICIVTDLTAQIQMRKIREAGLAGKINRLVSSEETGADKPDPAIFKLALKKMGVKPSETIMIGDSASKDQAGAEAVGIKTFIIK